MHFRLKNVVIIHVTTVQNIKSGLVMKTLRAYIFLPLPLLHPTNKDHYRPFSDVYGQLPSNLDQPSLKVTKEIHNEIDHQRKSLLVAGKVRGVITCGECCKPRCIYAKTRLSEDQQVELQRIRESDICNCVSSLFLSNDCIVVREGLLCSSVIETQYYSSVLVHFPPICYFYGLGEECLVNNEEIQELKTHYATVMPICFVCMHDGRNPSAASLQMCLRNKKPLCELYVVNICVTCVLSLCFHTTD